MRIGALLRIEVERAFKSRMFWLMLLLGIIITGIEFVIAPLRYSKDIIGAFDGNIGNTINTVFNSWFFSLQKNAIPLRQLYIMIMPLMAVFAYGYSAVSDIKSGYIENIYTRIDKKYYLIVKCVVSHIAGGIVVVVPLLMNLITMIFPFLLNYFCYIIQGFFNLEKYNPIRIMTVGYSYNNTLLNLIIEYIIICGITFAVYMYRGMHNEVL